MQETFRGIYIYIKKFTCESFDICDMTFVYRKHWKEKSKHNNMLVFKVFTSVTYIYFLFHVILISVTKFYVNYYSDVKPFY